MVEIILIFSPALLSLSGNWCYFKALCGESPTRLVETPAGLLNLSV